MVVVCVWGDTIDRVDDEHSATTVEDLAAFSSNKGGVRELGRNQHACATSQTTRVTRA